MRGSLVRRAYRASGGDGEGLGAPFGAGLRAIALVAALSAGGCSWSFAIGSLVDEDRTGSTAVRAVSPLSPDLGTEDWRRAKGALGVALDPHGNGSTVSWDNPETTLRGTFTPVGQPFVKSDEICRAFLATVTGQGNATSVQGTACRPSGEEWAIRDVKPWKRT